MTISPQPKLFVSKQQEQVLMAEDNDIEAWLAADVTSPVNTTHVTKQESTLDSDMDMDIIIIEASTTTSPATTTTRPDQSPEDILTTTVSSKPTATMAPALTAHCVVQNTELGDGNCMANGTVGTAHEFVDLGETDNVTQEEPEDIPVVSVQQAISIT
jgi:hypothetical protein